MSYRINSVKGNIIGIGFLWYRLKSYFKEGGERKITNIKIGIEEIKENVVYYIIIIITVVIYMIMKIDKSKRNRDIENNRKIEIIWTIIPSIILIIIGIPSIKLLNNIDDIYNPYMTVEIRGNQWYWNYNIKELGYNYDSYTKEGNYLIRLLSVDKPLFLPILTPIRLLLTSEDVIHSFTIPNLGIKIDTNPGRINSTILNILAPGIYYGQCSELCGILHSKMAIEIRGIRYKEFIEWAILNKNIKYELYLEIIKIL